MREEIELNDDQAARVSAIAQRLGVEDQRAFLRGFVEVLERVPWRDELGQRSTTERRNALLRAADAAEGFGRALRHLAGPEEKLPLMLEYRVDRAFRDLFSADAYAPRFGTSELQTYLRSIRSLFRTEADRLSPASGGRPQSRLGKSLGVLLAFFYRDTVGKPPGTPGGGRETPFSELVDLAIEALGDRYKGPQTRTVARYGASEIKRLESGEFRTPISPTGAVAAALRRIADDEDRESSPPETG